MHSDPDLSCPRPRPRAHPQLPAREWGAAQTLHVSLGGCGAWYSPSSHPRDIPGKGRREREVLGHHRVSPARTSGSTRTQCE